LPLAQKESYFFTWYLVSRTQKNNLLVTPNITWFARISFIFSCLFYMHKKDLSDIKGKNEAEDLRVDDAVKIV